MGPPCTKYFSILIILGGQKGLMMNSYLICSTYVITSPSTTMIDVPLSDRYSGLYLQWQYCTIKRVCCKPDACTISILSASVVALESYWDVCWFRELKVVFIPKHRTKSKLQWRIRSSYSVADLCLAVPFHMISRCCRLVFSTIMVQLSIYLHKIIWRSADDQQ